MKPLFSIHEGEFLVGDRSNRGLGRKFEVWVPTRDDGVDLLVTRKDRGGRPPRMGGPPPDSENQFFGEPRC